MQLKNVRLIICGIFVIGFASCYYDKADLVYPPDSAACDTTGITYSTTIVSIISANCYVCHSGSAINGGGIKLDAHSNLMIQVNNGQLLKSIQHLPGASAMPKNLAKLASCDITRISSWIKNGAPNN